jgi:hypothetical protein
MQWRMQWQMRALCAAAVLLVTACVSAVPYGQEPVINSPAFAVRIPAPGRPGYLQTIKFVDDGMRYVDRDSQFFISPAGEMCFRVRPNYPEIIYDAAYRNWCIYPQVVDRVEAATNDVTGINEVRLWCLRSYPQCAHAPDSGWVSNNISAGTVDYLRERAAVEDLISIMGGNVRFAQPPSGYLSNIGEISPLR